MWPSWFPERFSECRVLCFSDKLILLNTYHVYRIFLVALFLLPIFCQRFIGLFAIFLLKMVVWLGGISRYCDSYASGVKQLLLLFEGGMFVD